jgi:integrase
LKPKQYRHVTSDGLLALGLQLMDSAEEEVRSIGAIHLRLAKRYRDGFIIALLACIPLRRRTLANLRIGEHLMKIGRKWSLDIPAEDTKSHVPLEYEVPHLLWDRLEIFLSKYRPRFKGAATHDHLWPCQQGGPLKGGEIYEAVAWRTFKAFGFSVSPHRFRHAAATFWSERDPANVLVAKDLLGHASLKTTEKHYIMSRSRIAGRELAGILADFKESARRLQVRKRKQRRRIRVPADGANPGGRRATTVPEQVAQATVGAAA